MITVCLISTLFQLARVIGAQNVCAQGEYSTIHYCDGRRDDVPKENFEKIICFDFCEKLHFFEI